MEDIAHQSPLNATAGPVRLSTRQLKWAGAAAIVLATFLCYWPALRGQFIWDDDRHVSENRNLLDLNGLRRIWFRWGATPQYYPMTHTSFWIEHQLWGRDSTGYHTTNVLLHAINALLLWRLLRVLGVRGAWVAAAVFALHPVNVESVAWISERKNVLAMCFALLSMLAYLRQTGGAYALSLVLFLCALLSKSVVATMPAVLLVLIWWRWGRIARHHLLNLLPFFGAGIGMGIMTAWMERDYVGARGPDWALSIADRVLIAGRAICFYAGKIVWPTKLTFSYPKWGIDPLAFGQWMFPSAVVVMLGLLGHYRKRLGRGPAAAAMIYVGTLFPALGFINTYPMRYSFVADHFQYLSDPALMVLLAAGGARVLRRMPSRIVLTSLVLIALGLLSWRQAHVYAGSEQVWRDTIAKNPSSWMARYNLGVVLSYQADTARAAGDEDAAKRKLHEALDLFDQTESLRPQHEKVQVARADALAKLGRFDQALVIFQRELGKNPASASLRLRIARVMEETGRPDEAVAELAGVVRDEPEDAGALLELGMLLSRRGRPAEAAPYLERYLSLVPNDAQAHVALGFVYGELAQFNKAKQQFLRALEIEPESQRAQQGLELVRRATERQ